MFLKEAYEAVKCPGEPGVQGLWGGAWWRRGDYEVFDDREEQFLVCVVPSETRGARSEDRDAGNIVMGTWSEPMEGRKVPQLLTKGRSRGLAKARSITEGRAFHERGDLVYMPGEFGRAKLPSAANSKYRAEEEAS